jgi:hypothetical protein
MKRTPYCQGHEHPSSPAHTAGRSAKFKNTIIMLDISLAVTDRVQENAASLKAHLKKVGIAENASPG